MSAQASDVIMTPPPADTDGMQSAPGGTLNLVSLCLTYSIAGLDLICNLWSNGRGASYYSGPCIFSLSLLHPTSLDARMFCFANTPTMRYGERLELPRRNSLQSPSLVASKAFCIPLGAWHKIRVNSISAHLSVSGARLHFSRLFDEAQHLAFLSRSHSIRSTQETGIDYELPKQHNVNNTYTNHFNHVPKQSSQRVT